MFFSEKILTKANIISMTSSRFCLFRSVVPGIIRNCSEFAGFIALEEKNHETDQDEGQRAEGSECIGP